MIEKSNSKRYIMIKETGAKDSIRKKINQNDCDTLVSFLDKYDFPIKGSTIYGPLVREYLEANLLPDTNWIKIKGDSIRREIMWAFGYYYDKKSNKFYTESQMRGIWTDGNTYKGDYIKSNISKTFSVHSARISSMDFKLNSLIYRIIIKYDTKNDYGQLKKMIESNKPKLKN